MSEPKPIEGLIQRLARRAVGAGVTALGLLAAGFGATRYMSYKAESEFPPLGEWIEVEGLRQHVVERGEGPPVVFVHGSYGASQDFVNTILDEASAHYRCVLWDRPGHGYSERPEGEVDPGVQAEILLGVIRELGLERPLLVGFSYGGAVCLAAALEAPDELRGVVLLNWPSHPWPDPLDLEYRVVAVPGLGWLLSETLMPPLADWFGGSAIEEAFAPEPVPLAFAGSPLALALRPASYRANTEDLRLLRPFLRTQSRRYGELRVPVLALVAEGDRVVSPTIHVPQHEAQAPDVRQVRIEGAGHQLLYTRPELVLEAIESALAE